MSRAAVQRVPLGAFIDSQQRTTERYVHAAQTAFPGAAERTEERIFQSLNPESR